MLRRVASGEDPRLVELIDVDIWVVVNEVPHGFVSELVAKQLDNFIGLFLKYDSSAIQLGYQGKLRMRV